MKGFSLTEFLITSLIVTGTFLSAAGIFIATDRSDREASLMDRATQIIEKKMNEFKSIGYDKIVNVCPGEAYTGIYHIRWECEVDSPIPGIIKVRSTIEFPVDDRGLKKFVLEMYLTGEID